MIFSSIHTKDDYSNYPKAVQRAIEYLKSNDFTKMEPGVYEIEGKQLYAQVFDAMTEPLADRKPEVHEKYLDVQFLASGREKLGFTPDTGNYEVDEKFPCGEHADKSIIILQNFIRLEPEEILAIRAHMGGWDTAVKGGNAFIGKIFERSKLALLLHLADMGATYLMEG